MARVPVVIAISLCAVALGAGLFGQLSLARGEEEPAVPASNETSKEATPPSEESATPQTKESASRGAADALRIHLMDGSQVSGRLGSQEIDLETQFGKLTIPVVSVLSLTPGLASHPQIGQNMAELIDKLGSSAFAEREAAQKALTAMGPQVRGQLARAAEDADIERRTRVKAILEEFDQAEQEDDADDPAAASRRMIERDTVETTDFTVVGKIVPQEFDIISPYGSLRVRLSDIRRIERPATEKQNLQKTVVIDGSHMIARNMKDSMKETGIRLERGDKITITADGTVTLTPFGNQAVSTPEGAPNFGFFQQNKIANGALVGRIGQDGAIFRVGSKLNYTANRAGVLQLGIAFQNDPNNQVFPGEYKARIRVKKK